MPPVASVVIPAYNEGRIIDRCLDVLDPSADLQVIVVANGCRDDTAARARRHGVEVIERVEASKSAALNAGDAAAGEVMPRIYLDADIELTSADAQLLLDCLRTATGPIVASPAIRFDVDQSSALVKAFYRIYRQLPYICDGLVGSGCYAVNAAGRERWGEFPTITADDLYVQGRFAATERVVLHTASFVSHAPRTMAGLLAIRTRAYFGNLEAASAGLAGHMSDTSGNSMRELIRVVLRHPQRIGDAAVYVAVAAIARRRARRRTAADGWLTDDTSR